MPCLRQTWWCAGRCTGTGSRMRRAAVQRRQAVRARAGWPARVPKAGRAFLIAGVVVPLSKASRAAAASVQGASWPGCQRSSCQRALMPDQGGRMPSRAPGVVRLWVARRPRNDARVSPATGAAGTGSGDGCGLRAGSGGEYPLMLAGWQPGHGCVRMPWRSRQR